MVRILNPWMAQGMQIADSDGTYPTLRGCGGCGYQQGYVLDRGIAETEDTEEPLEKRSMRKTFAMQRIDEYKESDKASSLKMRDYKDSTDLILTAVSIDTSRADDVVRIDDTVPSMQSRQYKGGNNVMAHSTVRRLTPLECERLQGFQDGWTDIGEWTDSKGKVHKPADAPRYKALGNSIALPFWQYLARRICAQYERDITMGSLFSGIGGFELVFSRCGAKPLWASEVEEFCIAVTKRRFPDGMEECTD